MLRDTDSSSAFSSYGAELISHQTSLDQPRIMTLCSPPCVFFLDSYDPVYL